MSISQATPRIHSPIGARGMNLGLEDAYVFSRLVSLHQMQRYGALRRGVDDAVVKRIQLMSRVVLGKTYLARIIRYAMLHWFAKIPLFRRQFLKTVAGLDHRLEV